MPAAPFAKLLCSVDGGANQSGSISASIGQTLQFSIENPTGVTKGYRWVLYDFPPDMTEPAGWSTDPDDGSYYSVAQSPQAVTVTHWGKILPALYVNGATRTSPNPLLRDESTGIVTVSPNLGMPGISALEAQQFNTRGYPVDFMKSLALVDSATGSSLNAPADPADDGKFTKASGGDLVYSDFALSEIPVNAFSLLGKPDTGNGSATNITLDENAILARDTGNIFSLPVASNRILGRAGIGTDINDFEPNDYLFEDSGEQAVTLQPAPQDCQLLLSIADAGDDTATTSLFDYGDGLYLFTVLVVAIDESANEYVILRTIRGRRASGTLTLQTPVDIDAGDASSVAVTYANSSGSLAVKVDNDTGGGESINARVAVGWVHCVVPGAPVP